MINSTNIYLLNDLNVMFVYFWNKHWIIINNMATDQWPAKKQIKILHFILLLVLLRKLDNVKTCLFCKEFDILPDRVWVSRIILFWWEFSRGIHNLKIDFFFVKFYKRWGEDTGIANFEKLRISSSQKYCMSASQHSQI